jgi:DNA-binding NarL/FixJ family response regulator
MSHGKKKIAIIEDHPMVREHLAEMVNKDNKLEVCYEAEDVETAIRLIQKNPPDLAIVDITLKDSSGLVLIKKVKALLIKTKILVISMHEESSYARRTLSAGANGYITKNKSSDEIVSAIHKVLSGEVYLSEAMTSDVLKNLISGNAKKIAASPVEKLSDRELSVLEMIGRGLNNRAIAESLGVGLATVDTYRARIKEKMNLQNAFELQNLAIRWVNERV